MRILDPIVFPDNAFGTVALHGTLDLTGMQALTMNGGFAKHGAPIGFQLVGKHLSEDLLLRAESVVVTSQGPSGRRIPSSTIFENPLWVRLSCPVEAGLMAAVLAMGTVQDHRRNREVG
jgi:hypothetical protein